MRVPTSHSFKALPSLPTFSELQCNSIEVLVSFPYNIKIQRQAQHCSITVYQGTDRIEQKLNKYFPTG